MSVARTVAVPVAVKVTAKACEPLSAAVKVVSPGTVAVLPATARWTVPR